MEEDHQNYQASNTERNLSRFFFVVSAAEIWWQLYFERAMVYTQEHCESSGHKAFRGCALNCACNMISTRWSHPDSQAFGMPTLGVR